MTTCFIKWAYVYKPINGGPELSELFDTKKCALFNRALMLQAPVSYVSKVQRVSVEVEVEA